MEATITNKHIKKIDHIVLVTADIKACLAFYHSLGFKSEDEGNRYALYQGDFKINVHMLGQELKPNAHIAQPGTLDLCLEVEGPLRFWYQILDDVQERSEIGLKHGVKGTMKSFYIRDPDLNLIELCSYE